MNQDFVLTSENIGEALKNGRLSFIREQLCEMNVVDIALAIGELTDEELLLVFRILPKDISANVFSYLETQAKENLVKSISDAELKVLIDDLFLDDTVDFLEEVPASVVRRVLTHSDTETRNIINRFLQYPENSAGSIMTIEMVDIHDTLTAAQAIDYIRRTGLDKETVYTCYCIGPSRKLVGSVPLLSLLLCDENTVVSEIMESDQQLLSVNTLDDQEDVADMVRKYDLLSVPVVDNEGRLVGIITIDDIVDVIEEENTEDFEKMAMLRPSVSEYLKTGVFMLAKNRIGWLMLLMITATFTGKIIGGFEDMLAAVAGLTAAIPMLMNTSGNSGNQASTLIIRGLATGEVTLRDAAKVFLKELRVGLLCASALSIVNFCLMSVTGTGGFQVFLVIAASMFFAVLTAQMIGCMLPLAAKAVKLDPALMAGPMITTIVDALTLLIYLSIAKLFLF